MLKPADFSPSPIFLSSITTQTSSHHTPALQAQHLICQDCSLASTGQTANADSFLGAFVFPVYSRVDFAYPQHLFLDPCIVVD